MRKAPAIAGLVLAVLGLIALVVQEIPYDRDETVVELGPVQVRGETQDTVEIPPLVGGILLAGGVGLLVWAARGRA